MSREPLVVLLEKIMGYKLIIQAENGNQALALALINEPDAVLMDTHMPDREGYDICALMRQQSYGERIPIIGMSNDMDPKVRDAWMQAGANGFIDKADIVSEFDEMLEAALANYQ